MKKYVTITFYASGAFSVTSEAGDDISHLSIKSHQCLKHRRRPTSIGIRTRVRRRPQNQHTKQPLGRNTTVNVPVSPPIGRSRPKAADGVKGGSCSDIVLDHKYINQPQNLQSAALSNSSYRDDEDDGDADDDEDDHHHHSSIKRPSGQSLSIKNGNGVCPCEKEIVKNKTAVNFQRKN